MKKGKTGGGKEGKKEKKPQHTREVTDDGCSPYFWVFLGDGLFESKTTKQNSASSESDDEEGAEDGEDFVGEKPDGGRFVVLGRPNWFVGYWLLVCWLLVIGC